MKELLKNMSIRGAGCAAAALTVALTSPAMAQALHPEIPRAWNDREVQGFELPLAQPGHSPRYLSAAEYYALEVIPIYRSYPVYVPGTEPAGYLDSPKEKDPEIIFDPAKLRTEEDCIRAGGIVFRAPREFRPVGVAFKLTIDAIRASHAIARDGVIPFIHYVVRKKGVVELGIVSCANCILACCPDGTVIDGAQGNFPWARRDALQAINDHRPDRDQATLDFERKLYAAPGSKTLRSCMPRRRLNGFGVSKPLSLGSSRAKAPVPPSRCIFLR